MDIVLGGYFDKNFGDDAMQSLLVSSMPEHDFYVNCGQREMLTHLEGFKNVHINTDCEKAELFVNVIGTGFMYKGKRAKAEKLFTMLTNKGKKYPRSALLNCSLESFDSALGRFFANYDLKKYNLITCRDKKSYNYLCQNIKGASIKLYPDMVFSDNYKINSLHGGNILGVAPVRRMYSSHNYEYYKKLAYICDSFAQNHGYGIKIYAFDNGLENDVCAATCIKAMMKNPSVAQIEVYNGNPEEFANIISGCSLFIGSRFHSVVLAKSMNIKCVAVYDMEKLENLCNECNIPKFTKSELSYENIINAFDIPVGAPGDFTGAKGHIEALREFIKN